MDGDRDGAHIVDEGFINRKAGTGIDHLVSWIAVGLLTEADRRFGPGKDDNPLRRGLDSPRFTQVLCNSLSKGKDSLGITVMGGRIRGR
jgi:hypothetical protein